MSFQTVVMRPAGNSNEPTTPVVLSASQNYVVTDANGLAGIVPTSAGFTGPLQVNVMATVGTNAMLDYPLQLLPEFESELGGFRIQQADSACACATAPANRRRAVKAIVEVM